MAVQDHPRYDEWSEALDNLQAANEAYRAGIGRLDARTVDSLKFNLDWAQSRYNKIASEIDA